MTVGTGYAGLLVAVLLTTGCTTFVRPSHGTVPAPYPQSRVIQGVRWDFSTLDTLRRAPGSDLWPCAWAQDDDLYCAWGDGGGFNGDDHAGRVSLGFARISGIPSGEAEDALAGKDIWGERPYAQVAGTFGGKVGSVISVNGVLYAIGGFWTAGQTPDPVHKSGRGPVNSVAWSSDFARSWQLAAWSSPDPLGTFLDIGRDSGATRGEFLFIYYLRRGDERHLYLKRIAPAQLKDDPSAGGAVEYFSGVALFGRQPRWSASADKAIPVFSDPNNVQGPSAVYDAVLGRYLLTVGHYSSGNDDDSSPGQVGLFEGPHAWGPWRTVGYYDDWGGAALNAESRGDFLSLRLPAKWFDPLGTTFWAVFSGLKSLDSFNVVRGTLQMAAEPRGHR